MLLDNKECWLDVLLDDVEKDKFFNSIASLQAFLLRDVVYENIEGLMNELTSCKLNNPFYIKVELADAEVERHTVWDIIKRIVEIGTDVVRLECKLLGIFCKKKEMLLRLLFKIRAILIYPAK